MGDFPGVTEQELTRQRRDAATALLNLARQVDGQAAIEASRTAEIDVVVQALSQLTTGGTVGSQFEARREAMGLVVQERIAWDLVAASELLARRGKWLAWVGVVIALGQLLVALAVFTGGR
jgi:hypothetical protein